MNPEEPDVLITANNLRIYEQRRNDEQFKEAMRKVSGCFGECTCADSCACSLKLLCLIEWIDRNTAK